MPANTPSDEVGGYVDPKAMPGLKTERTTEEIVADIVAEGPTAMAPEGHNVSVEERKRRALAQAKRDQAGLDAFFNEPEEPADGTPQADYDEGGEDTPVDPE